MDKAVFLEKKQAAIEKILMQNRLLQDELEATNRGLLALNLEVEKKNDEVQAITEQLWQVARMATMGELAASIAHELNNPLATVSLRVESLAAQIPPSDPRQRPLQIISQEVERMASLIKNLLDFSRRSQRQISKVDICHEADYSLELIYYHFRRNGIRVLRDYQPELPLLHADRQGLQQLFLNLFTNASDAMPRGGMLTIKIYKEFADADCIAVDVTDTGIGIHHDNLSKIMEPFFTTKPEGKGTGLGLSICCRIVREHHGIMTITSKVNKGTAVALKFPIVDLNPGGTDLNLMY